MKAIGYTQSLEISHPESLVDMDIPMPVATGHDLLVKIESIAVNPVDYKIRQYVAPAKGKYKVLGWDAVGEVIAIGDGVTLFKPGDIVFYAGDLDRQGCNAEYQLVDERIVGRKPKNLSNAEAAALPLTSVTAWEILFDHFAIKQQLPGSNEKSSDVILVIGAAGGVGSILIQLAKTITGATIIATASRDSSQNWVRKLGADYIIDHTQALQAQIDDIHKQQKVGPVTHIVSLHNTESYFDNYADILAPFGKIALIDDPNQSLNVMKLKSKSQSLHFEFMFTRSMYNVPDMHEQGRLLNRLSDLIDQGYIQTTAGKNLGTINAENLKFAHQELESRRSIGKIVLEGF